MSNNIIACVYFSDDTESWNKQGVGIVNTKIDVLRNIIINLE